MHCESCLASGNVERSDVLGLTLCGNCFAEHNPQLRCHQDQDQDQDQDQVGTTTLSGSSPGPGGNSAPPGPGGKSESEPTELALLIGEYQQERLSPAEVKLGDLPSRAGPVQRRVAEHIGLLMGLRQAVGDDRPLPYASSMAVRAGLAPDKRTASKAIRALVRFGVIHHVGSLPPQRPGLDGTKLYEPPPPEADS